MHDLKNQHPQQHGSTIILFALLLPIFISLAALAVDLGRIYVVKAELQNAADAAALFGASSLTKQTPDAPSANYAHPNWSYASTKASQGINLNKADNRALSDGVIEVGYWNVKHTPEGMQSTGITPTVYDKPAVRVTISLADGSNGGPLNLFFAPIFGKNFQNISASSLAFISAPAEVKAGGLFPTAMASCLFQYYWDSTTGKPKLDPATGKPYVFKIGSAYHYPPCSSGEWTSFSVDSNNVPVIKQLIATGNPTSLSIGDSIWVETGSKTALYGDVAFPKDVLVAVIGSVDTHSYQSIIAFAPFHIINSVGGNDKYIEGYFMDDYTGSLTDIGNGGGIDYGVVTPPALGE